MPPQDRLDIGVRRNDTTWTCGLHDRSSHGRYGTVDLDPCGLEATES